MRLVLSLLIILNVTVFTLPSSANEELDKECATYCVDNGHTDGHYLRPDSGSQCDEGFKVDETNDICCCSVDESEE